MSDSRTPRVDDLDKLVSELHERTPASPSQAAGDTPELGEWLHRVRELDGSDLLLVAGLPPLGRVRGQVVRLLGEPMTGQAIEDAVLPMVASRLRDRYRNGEAIDLAFTLHGLGRFRMNLHHERGRAKTPVSILP